MNPPALRWLAAFAVAYGLLHHQGFVLARLGEFGDTGTRWADWIDLATPYLLLGPAAGVLVALRTGIRPWLVFAVGAVAYVEGHGIHLAANSIDNAISEVPAGAGPIPVVVADVVHFWDEMVGHYIWYGGLTLIVVAMVGAAWSVSDGEERGHGDDQVTSGWRILEIALALLFATTYVTNALEGSTAPMALAAAVGFVVWAASVRPGNRARSLIRVLMLWVFGPAVLMLAGYGLIHRGFPSPTDIGWNPLA